VDSKIGADGRKDLFDWVSKQLSGLSNFAEAAQLLKPASSAMTVQSGYSAFWFCVYNISQIVLICPILLNKIYDGLLLG